MTEQGKPESRIPAGLSQQGEYTPAGEGQGVAETFTAREVADAFGVDIARVHAAMRGEFDLDAEATIVSKQAQELADVILGDQPQSVRQGVLIELGAFTPRPDHEWGLGEKAVGEESDRLVRRADKGDEQRG